MPPEIIYPNVETTDHIKNLIVDKMANLEHACDYMVS